MGQRTWLRLIDDFNDGEVDFILDNFIDFSRFFDVLKKKDLFHLLDPETEGSEDWVNEYLIHLYTKDKSAFYGYVQQYLGDIKIEDGKAYFYSRNREDLSYLFCDISRYNSSRDIVEKMLDDGDDFWEPFYSTTDDVYRDVVSELDNKNLQTLGTKIIFELKDINVDTETELLENIAQEQNHPEYVIVDSSNIEKILDDEETMNYLFREHLGDIRSDLYSLHSTAYNTAYRDDLWNEMWSELDTYFVGQGQFVTETYEYQNQKPRSVEYFKLEIRDFDTLILDYLEENKKYGNSGTLSYQSNFISVLSEAVECLRMSEIDYPNYREVDKNINLYFNDYI